MGLCLIITSDHGGAVSGRPQHRGPEGSPDRGQRPAQTDPDPGDRAGVTEEHGEQLIQHTLHLLLNSPQRTFTPTHDSAHLLPHTLISTLHEEGWGRG